MLLLLLLTFIRRLESSLVPGRLLATFLCLLLLSLRHLMFECVSPLIVSVSLVDIYVGFGVPAIRQNTYGNYADLKKWQL